MEGFSSNLTQMFTTTGQCAEPILPLYQLCQRTLVGYESHSAIVLVLPRNKGGKMHLKVLKDKWRDRRTEDGPATSAKPHVPYIKG